MQRILLLSYKFVIFFFVVQNVVHIVFSDVFAFYSYQGIMHFRTPVYVDVCWSISSDGWLKLDIRISGITKKVIKN